MSVPEGPKVIALQAKNGLGTRIELRRLGYMAVLMLGGVLTAYAFPGLTKLVMALVLVLSFLSLFMYRAKVRVGADGISIRAEGFPAFISWRKIRALSEQSEGVLLTLEGGKTLLLPHRRPNELRHHLNARWQWFHTAPEIEPPAALLHEVDDEEGSYREAAPPPLDTLLQIVEDPRVALEVRARAAKWALERGGKQTKTRVRVAAKQHLDDEAKETLLKVLEETQTAS